MNVEMLANDIVIDFWHEVLANYLDDEGGEKLKEIFPSWLNDYISNFEGKDYNFDKKYLIKRVKQKIVAMYDMDVDVD